VAATLILIVVLTVIVIPAIVVLAIGQIDDRRAKRSPVEPSGAEGELPELLRRPLRAGRAT
jgi:hypothetical protein